MRNGRRAAVVAALLVVAVAATAHAHTLFLKLESFFLEPNSTNVVALLNGDFDRSENVISRDRMIDVRVVGPGGTANPPASAWRDTAMFRSDPDSLDTALLTFETGEAGTYAIGVSTAPTVFTLTAQEFNEYLVHDGIVDMIEQRAADGTTNDEATERYSKHVKAIVQVGDARSGEWSLELGYPVELIPQENPYELGVGDDLEVLFLSGGEPVANQLVYANYESHHQHEGDEHVEAVTTRTDERGVVTIPLSAAGRWYLRTIHMVETTSEPDVDYESNWATLTFQVR